MADFAFNRRTPYFQPQAASATVTLDRATFDILIKRANLNHNAGHIKTSLPVVQDVEAVLISKTEHTDLLSAAERYTCLQRHLLQGGVPQETITLLSDNVQAAAHSEHSQTQNNVGSHTEEFVKNIQFAGRATSGQHSRVHSQPRDSNNNVKSTPNRSQKSVQPAVQNTYEDCGDGENAYLDNEDEASAVDEAPLNQGQQYARSCQRSLILTGLPDFTSLGDVTSVIRGGPLLDTYYRKADQCAFVSFLREEDAMQFLNHAKRYGSYIRNKRVSVRWAERQFYLTGHAAYQISHGASRNIVIRRCDPSHTEASVRDDLEHIHNLVVIKIEFVGGSCYIKTNSVNNAMFARTCLSSRTKYKGSKIDWDVDECAQPLNVPYQTKHVPKPPFSTEKKPASKLQNRFVMLHLDDDDDGDEIDSSEGQDLSDSEDTCASVSDSTAASRY